MCLIYYLSCLLPCLLCSTAVTQVPLHPPLPARVCGPACLHILLFLLCGCCPRCPFGDNPLSRGDIVGLRVPCLCPTRHRAVSPLSSRVVRGAAHLAADGMGQGGCLWRFWTKLCQTVQSALSRNCFLGRSWGVTIIFLGIRQ